MTKPQVGLSIYLSIYLSIDIYLLNHSKTIIPDEDKDVALNTHIHAYTHTRKHTYIHTHIHTYTHTHTHTHTLNMLYFLDRRERTRRR